MKKQWLRIVLFAVTLLGVVVGWNWNHLITDSNLIEASFRHSFTATNPMLAEGDAAPNDLNPSAVEAPSIDSSRIWSDLDALTFTRYAEDDRSAARDYITQQLQAAGWTVEEQPFDNGVNLYAERLGTNPDADAILLGAHYDTVDQSPGADDNATAVATVLETARLLKALPTPRTLKIVFFDQEETGLVGSFAFANDISNREHLAGAVILEMMGYACHTDGCQHYPSLLPINPPTTRGDFLAVIGDQGHHALIDSFVQASQPELPQVLTLPVPLLGPFTPDLLRSDHAPFWDKGIGAVMVTDTANFRNPNYHQSTDTVESLDQPFFLGSAQLVVNAVTALLHRTESLETNTNSAIPPSSPLPSTFSL